MLAAGLASGCASLPPLKHVTLSPPQTARAPARPSDWRVRRVLVPEYLDNYQIQQRTEDYVIAPLPNARWAERLPAAITSLLQQTIDEKLVNHRDRPYVVHVSVDTFEPQPDDRVVLSADWRVTDGSGSLVARDTALITEPLAENMRHRPGEIGQAMSAAVRELAMQILARTG